MALTAYISYHQVLVKSKLLCDSYIEVYRCGGLQSECLEIRTLFHDIFSKENVLISENLFFRISRRFMIPCDLTSLLNSLSFPTVFLNLQWKCLDTRNYWEAFTCHCESRHILFTQYSEGSVVWRICVLLIIEVHRFMHA